MAVASDDLARFSLLTGASGVYASPSTDESEGGILRSLRGDFTWEAWIQIRLVKGRAMGADAGHGCWWIHAPAWACGLTADLRVVVAEDGDWHMSVPSTARALSSRRWHHVAVSRRAQGNLCELLVDGECVQLEALADSERLRLPMAPSAGFRVGWAPVPDSPCELLLHEVRLWSTCLPQGVVRRWLNASVSTEHPSGNHLHAYWSLSSGFPTPTEYDLSGHGHDLVIRSATPAHWLRATPPSLRRSATSDVARLLTYQEADTERSSERVRFVVELEVLPQLDVTYYAYQAVTVVLMINFPCFPSPSLTAPGKGTGIIHSLQEFVRRLPSGFSLSIYAASERQEDSFQSLLWCARLDADAKTRACKTLDRVVVKKPMAEEEVTSWVVASVRNVKLALRHGSERQHPFVSTVVFVTDRLPREPEQELLSGMDGLQSATSSVNLHVVHVGATEPLPKQGSEQVTMSCLVAQYVGCEDDFEWVLAVIFAQTQELVLTRAELSFESFGDASFFFAEQSQPVFHRYVGNQPLTQLVIPVGSCAYSNHLQLTGIATFTAKPHQQPPLIVITMTYFGNDERRHVCQVSLRPTPDITDHLYIECTLRNKRLQISDSDVQLLEQRRALMRKKMTFVSEFVSHEIAEAENAFKKVNIMKEGLWAKRKWLVGRGLRLFSETELQSLSEEARVARAAFTRRTDSLQSTFTASSRGPDTRGSSRGKNNPGSNAFRVRVDEESKAGSEIIGSDDEEDQSGEQKLQKICVKLSIQGKALSEHEAKMEDLFVSVRLAEARGPVIMNDTRRSWMVRYHDMISCKKAVIDSTLAKDFLEWMLEFQEERITTRQEVEAEVQSTNALIARFDKELSKRRKRALLCTKEVVGVVIDEFEASGRIEAAKRDVMRCRLMKTLSLTQDMSASCIYVCFPMEISQQDVPTKSNAKGFMNLVHGLCAGLRQMCDACSESPVCCRIAFNEAFLWWGLEQQETRPTTEESIATANSEARRAVQSNAWAFVVVSYNSLFSSAKATAEVRDALAIARDQAKPVFHIQLESPYEGLEDFRSQWTHRIHSGNVSTTARVPVEREYLTWRQNFSSFQALVSSVRDVETVVAPKSLGICDCIHAVDAMSWRYPCLECLWPLLGSSQLTDAQDGEAVDPPQEYPDRWFSHLVRQIGTWVDTTNSVSLQTAPRSYHIDPNAISSLCREWDVYQHEQIRLLTAKWAEASTRRTKEIQRQIGKLFKVYEEEAHDIVVLQFKLFKRKREVLESMSDRINNLVDERKLLETWVEKHGFDETGTDYGRRSKENERMMSEELWQRMHQADAKSLRLELLEDQIDSPPDDELAEAKAALDAALRHASRAILDIGRGHIEDRYRSLSRRFKRDEYINKIRIANAKCDEQRAQIARMEEVFDQAERILRAMRDQRDGFVSEDATAFFNASYLEVHSPPSATTQDVDQQQLQKLANDLDFHSTLCTSILSQVFQSQLASATASEYRAKLRDAMCSFIDVYAPTIPASEDVDMVSKATAAGFKDFCQFVPEEPKTSYESLLAMRELVDKEALEDREIQRVWGEWKMRFIDSLMLSHTQRWWTQCRELLNFSTELLGNVKSALDESFVSRGGSERAFRDAVADREKLGHRLALLQRRLIETRQRQQSLLLLLQISRKCYETSSAVMNAKLQNVKTDVMFKKWSGISDYHVAMIGNLFDWRSQCSQQLDSLEADIKKCQDSLSLCDGIIDSRRQAWIKHSIADTMACTKAEGLQQLAHRTVDLILSLERQRVFKQFRVVDPRGQWLTLPTLTAWHDGYVREHQREEALRKAGGKQIAVGRSGVDDLLVQLSIARLDVIKQEKLRDALHRKLHVLERIYSEQVELRHIVENEAQLYHSLGSRMAERVSFLREQYEASGESEYLRVGVEDDSNVVSSIDRRSAVQAVRESRDLISDMIKSAQQDYLHVEATTCQIAWRMREHIACGRRGERAIEDVRSELVHVENYLQVLKAKDNELFDLSLRSETPVEHGAPYDTDCMGMDIASGRSVFDFYARDQWFRGCLDQTTTLGERVKSLREVLSSLVGLQQSASRPSAREINGSTNSQPEDDSTREGEAVGQDEQLAILEQELQSTELALLLNRFESRRAEKTSEALKVALINRFEGDEASLRDGFNVLSDDDQRDLNTVLSERKLHSRMFSVAIYTTERERMFALLRELATSFDPRDVVGNLSEVIFGASLDRNDLKLIFLLQSRAHVEEQWRVALVAFFFARMFRRASLKKAASIRSSRASVLAREKLKHSCSDLQVAGAVLATHSSQLHFSPSLSLSESSVKRLRDLLLCIDVVGEVGSLQRLALGIVMHQPLHRILAPLTADGAKAVYQIADEMEQRRAVVEHRPPKPTLLQVMLRDRYSIKIEWKPVTMDRDLVYVAEISEHQPSPTNFTSDHPQKRYWTQFLTTEKTAHSFFNLHPGHSYWVRVRSGFSRTRLGSPCLPMLVSTLAE